MNILALSHEYPPLGGGGANAARNLLKGFAERGHKVALFTTFCDKRSLYHKVDISDNMRVIPVHSKREREDSCSFFEMLDYLIKCYRKVKEELDGDHEKFDVCLVFFGIPSGPIGYIIKKQYGIPYIIRFGGGDIPGFQKRFTVVYKFLAPFIKAIWREADARIANSEGLQNMAYAFCDKYEFQIIPNGVNLDVFTPHEKSIFKKIDKEIDCNKDSIVLLFVSRLIERKGLQHIIPKLKYIEDKSGIKIQLKVVGEGPYRGTLEHIAMTENTMDMIEFCGEQRGEKLIESYRNADVFILPSSNEGMPNVVLEAMACGLPVVMTPCQGSTELIFGNGIISDIYSFADAIIELCIDCGKRQAMGRRSRELVQEKFSWDSVIEAYISELSEIVNGL